MLVRLVLTDLEQRWHPLAANVPFIVVAVPLVKLLMGPGVASGMPMAMLIISSWEFARRTAYDDDLGGWWVFLRALPLTPATVVTVRYATNLVAVLVYAAVALATAFVFPYVGQAVSPGAWAAVIACSIGASIVNVAVLNALYYRFGYRAVTTALPYLLIPYGAALFFVLSPLRRLPPTVAFLSTVGRGLHWLVLHPAAAVVTVFAGVFLMTGVSWAYAVLVLSRKELA